MKRIIIGIPVLILTLLAVLLVAPSFIDWSKYKAEAQKQIKGFTGYDVALNGDLSFGILPAPHVSIEDVVVKAPEGSAAENLATLERLDASVALKPLFSGEIVVSAVELVKPDITLEILKNGKGNWVTPEIEKITTAKDAVPEQARDKASEAGSKAAQAVSLEKVTIDQGRFAYSANGKTTEVKDINLDVKADTLQGPFDLSGDVVFGGAPVTFKATTGALEKGAESISVKLEADYNGVAVNYAGIAGLKAPFELQGETRIGTNSLAATAKKFGAQDTGLSNESASLNGLLTASSEKLSFKNASLDVAGQKFAADFSTTLNPLYVQGTFKSADTFNLDKVMPAAGKKTSSGGASGAAGGAAMVNDITKALPETLSMPMAFGADVKFVLPGLIYNNQVFNGVTLALAKKDKSFQAKFTADQIPGKGKVDASADLNFAEKSISQKTGGEIYSGPSLAFALKGSTPDLPFTLKALSGQDSKIGFKAAAVDGSGTMRPGKVVVNESTITLDGKSYKVSGALEGQGVLLNATAMNAQVMLKGDLTDGTKLSNAALQIKHPNLAKAIQDFSGSPTQNDMLAQPIDFYTNIDQAGTAYKLTNIKAKLGQASMDGALTYDGGSSKPDISGALSFGDLVLQSAPATKSGGGNAGGAASAKTSSRWSSAPIDTAWMNLANIDLDIKAKSIKYESWDLSEPHLKFTLKDGVLNIADLGSGLYGGSIALNGVVKPASGGGLSVEGATSMKGIQMEPLVKSLAGNKIIKGQGSINMETSLKAAGVSHAALVNSLSGQGTTTGSAIVLEGIDINRFVRALSEESKAGDSLLHLWKGTTNGGSTAFDTLDGAFAIQNGIVDISKLNLDGPRAAVATTGKIDIPAWTIATAHTMSVKDRNDVPPFTINISGPLDNPAQTFAQGAINDYLQRKISRKLEKVLSKELEGKLDGELGNVIGGLLGTKSSNDNAPQQAEPAGGGEEPAAPEEAQPVQQQQQQPTPEQQVEDAFKGLLKGLR